MLSDASELHGIDDTHDSCAVSRYFVLLRYTAVYRDRPWRYWYRRVVIDDKYRVVVGYRTTLVEIGRSALKNLYILFS